MKKLMFAAVACAAITGLAVESKNIVGYAPGVLQPGYTLITPQFTAVGGSNIDAAGGLTAIGSDTSDNVLISLLDEFGTATETYVWNDWMFDAACWMDPDEYTELETMPLVPGQSLWVQGSSAAQSIQSSGEVASEDALVKLQAGYTIGGNPFPVSIPVQEVLAEGTDISDNVLISLLDEFGTATTTYVWNDWMFDSACWMDPDEYTQAEGSITAGQGLWIQGSSDAQFIRFPAPEL